jgi:hypothetical protein
MRGAFACLAVAAGLSACATSKTRPPSSVQTYQLGFLRADYRDYRTGDICTAEPPGDRESVRQSDGSGP